MKRLKQSQKMRIIISGVAIYTTAKQIRWNLFGFINQAAAAQKALEALEHIRSGKGAADKCATGLCGTWEGLQVQLDML
jgi:hypothetical protein